MSAISVHAATPAPAPTPSAAPAPAEAGSAFLALLGEMSHATAKTPDATAPAKAAAPDPDASTVNALAALAAALEGLPGAAPNGAALAASPDAASPSPSAASPAPTTAVGQRGGGTSVNSWQAPLKALLQSDPSLGVSDFQIKTFLAPAGAAPAKAGGTPLGADAARSPLAGAVSAPGPAPAKGAPPQAALAGVAAATLRVALPQPTPTAPAASPAAATASPPAPLPGAAGPATAVTVPPVATGSVPSATHPALGADRSTPRPAPAPVAAPPEVAEAPASNPAHGDARRDSAPATAATPDATAGSAPQAAVPLALLPAFIADQASALVSAQDAGDVGQATPSPIEPTKAPQAVKELSIGLEPAELGQMTLKLRLSGGKLSVTIAVADPKTLASIENDRALIAARLGAGDQTLGDLVIQRQTETASPHDFSSDSGAEPSRSDNDANASNASNAGDRRPGGSPRGGARGGRAFGDLA